MHDDTLKISIALTRCFYCVEAGDLLIGKRLTGTNTLRELDGKVCHMEPCPKCAEWMKQGVILIGIIPEKSDKGWDKRPANAEDRTRWMPNPYRSGLYSVMKDEAVRRIFGGLFGAESVAMMLRTRWTFIEHKLAESIGLIDLGEIKPTTAC